LEVKDYHLDIFNSECMPGAMSVQCFAHLGQDIGQALIQFTFKPFNREP